MKYLILPLMLILFSLILSPAIYAQTDPIDYQQLNETIAALSDQLMGVFLAFLTFQTFLDIFK